MFDGVLHDGVLHAWLDEIFIFAKGQCFMFCKDFMRWAKKGSHHGHANAATTACICDAVGPPWLKDPSDAKIVSQNEYERDERS